MCMNKMAVGRYWKIQLEMQTWVLRHTTTHTCFNKALLKFKSLEWNMFVYEWIIENCLCFHPYINVECWLHACLCNYHNMSHGCECGNCHQCTFLSLLIPQLANQRKYYWISFFCGKEKTIQLELLQTWSRFHINDEWHHDENRHNND